MLLLECNVEESSRAHKSYKVSILQGYVRIARSEPGCLSPNSCHYLDCRYVYTYLPYRTSSRSREVNTISLWQLTAIEWELKKFASGSTRSTSSTCEGFSSAERLLYGSF